MREPRPQSRSLKARGLSKVTVLVPEASAEGLRQFARELCRRQEAGAEGSTWSRVQDQYSFQFLTVTQMGTLAIQVSLVFWSTVFTSHQ